MKIFGVLLRHQDLNEQRLTILFEKKICYDF